MKKILVVFTGGTIGSKVSDSTIDVDESIGYLLIEKFFEISHLKVEFSTIQPLNILSENCTPKDWEKLYKSIKEEKIEDYDGIIITHGTDTLPYTSSMMSYLFADLEIPMVITASNFALDQPKSNGIRNFISSVEFICATGMPGIFILYEDEMGIEKLYIGSRLTEANPFNDQFGSFGEIDFGYLKDGILIRHKHRFNPSNKELIKKRKPLIIENLQFKNEILAIKPFPGLNYNYFNIEKIQPKAIIHSLYHSATACIKNDKNSLPDFIERCIKQGIDFYLTSFKDINDDLYITSRELLVHGAIPLQNISFEAVVAKLWLAYNLDIEDPISFVKNERYFEFLRA